MEQKVVLVTGGTGGIGQEVIKKFLSEGYIVCYTYYTNRLNESNENCFGYEYCASRESEPIDKIVEDITQKFGKIDVLVNNLGKTNDKLSLKMTSEDFIDILDTNLVTTFNFSQAVLKSMRKKKNGSIINISSVVGQSGNLGQINYSASKSAMYGMTKSFVKEIGRKNIRMNCVSPGFIETKMTDVLLDEIKKNMGEAISMKRFGKASEVANVIYFLASDQSSYINGQNIIVDGGMI